MAQATHQQQQGTLHNKLPSGANLVSQSLDPVKLSLAKRKASNDESRFKGIGSRFNNL
mgnify:CR=1 FL=1